MALIASNMLFAVGFALYFYITHLGYRALPFLQRTEVFLYPSSLAVVLFFLLLIFGMLGEPYRVSATRVMAGRPCQGLSPSSQPPRRPPRW